MRINSEDTKESTKAFLASIINVWTKSDVYKRYVAHKNNLNYLEIFETPDKINEKMLIDKINEIVG